MPDLNAQQIVNFIGDLPHYHHERVGDEWGALRITDGTILLPAANEGDDEQPIIRARWQGDAARESRVIATRFAELAITEAAHFYADTGESPTIHAVVVNLFDHFEFRTGESLSYGEHAMGAKGLKALAGFGANVAGNIAASVAQKTVGL